MENDEVVNEIVDHIKTINFNQTITGGEQVSLFETTIRYLGGLVSGNSLYCLHFQDRPY
jgi:mannosyl-oligosaccharide alpha-1,2-mannosidase